MKAKECVVQFDFIKQCEDAKEVSMVLPEDKVINIDCSDYNKVYAFGFNELDYNNSDIPIKKYEAIKQQTELITELLGEVNTTDDLYARMEKYFKAACYIVFSSHGTFREVIDCLQDHVKRTLLITAIPADLKDRLDVYIKYLEELNEVPKDFRPTKANPKPIPTGTKINLVSGLLNRINKLQNNTYFELMLEERNNVLDFTGLLQENKCINILIPDSMFPTQTEKDTFCCYMFKKIMAGLKKRELLWFDPEHPENDQRIKVNLMIDEIYQLENLQIAVAKIFNQVAKFRFKPVLSAHNLQQLEKPLANQIVNSAPDVIFLQNCTEEVFKPFEKRIKNYTSDTLVSIPKYHAITILRTNTGATINALVKLPGKLTDRIKIKKAVKS